MPPRIDVKLSPGQGAPLASFDIASVDGTHRIDYASVLPPRLLGLGAVSA